MNFSVCHEPQCTAVVLNIYNHLLNVHSLNFTDEYIASLRTSSGKRERQILKAKKKLSTPIGKKKNEKLISHPEHEKPKNKKFGESRTGNVRKKQNTLNIFSSNVSTVDSTQYNTKIGSEAEPLLVDKTNNKEKGKSCSSSSFLKRTVHRTFSSPACSGDILPNEQAAKTELSNPQLKRRKCDRTEDSVKSTLINKCEETKSKKKKSQSFNKILNKKSSQPKLCKISHVESLKNVEFGIANQSTTIDPADTTAQRLLASEQSGKILNSMQKDDLSLRQAESHNQVLNHVEPCKKTVHRSGHKEKDKFCSRSTLLDHISAKNEKTLKKTKTATYNDVSCDDGNSKCKRKNSYTTDNSIIETSKTKINKTSKLKEGKSTKPSKSVLCKISLVKSLKKEESGFANQPTTENLADATDQGVVFSEKSRKRCNSVQTGNQSLERGNESEIDTEFKQEPSSSLDDALQNTTIIDLGHIKSEAISCPEIDDPELFPSREPMEITDVDNDNAVNESQDVHLLEKSGIKQEPSSCLESTPQNRTNMNSSHDIKSEVISVAEVTPVISPSPDQVKKRASPSKLQTTASNPSKSQRCFRPAVPPPPPPPPPPLGLFHWPQNLRGCNAFRSINLQHKSGSLHSSTQKTLLRGQLLSTDQTNCPDMPATLNITNSNSSGIGKPCLNQSSPSSVVLPKLITKELNHLNSTLSVNNEKLVQVETIDDSEHSKSFQCSQANSSLNEDACTIIDLCDDTSHVTSTTPVSSTLTDDTPASMSHDEIMYRFLVSQHAIRHLSCCIDPPTNAGTVSFNEASNVQSVLMLLLFLKSGGDMALLCVLTVFDVLGAQNVKGNITVQHEGSGKTVILSKSEQNYIRNFIKNVRPVLSKDSYGFLFTINGLPFTENLIRQAVRYCWVRAQVGFDVSVLWRHVKQTTVECVSARNNDESQNSGISSTSAIEVKVSRNHEQGTG